MSSGETHLRFAPSHLTLTLTHRSPAPSFLCPLALPRGPCPAGHASEHACPVVVSFPADSTPTGTCGSRGTESVADEPSEQLPGTDRLGQSESLPQEFGCGNKRIKQLTTGSKARRCHEVGLGPSQVSTDRGEEGAPVGRGRRTLQKHAGGVRRALWSERSTEQAPADSERLRSKPSSL